MALLGEGDTAWPAQEAFHHKRHRPGQELPSSLHRVTARRVWGHRAGRSGRPGSGWTPLLLLTASTRPPRLGGSLLGLLGGSAPGGSSPGLLTVNSCQALLRPLRLPALQGGRQVGKAEKSCTSLLKIDTGVGSRDHIMRQTPVCPARQWEPPPALTGTMTSDL